MPVERLSAVSGRKPFEERKKARNTDCSTHDVVHIRCVDDHIGPMIMMFSKQVSLKIGGERKATDLVAPSTANSNNHQKTFHP